MTTIEEHRQRVYEIVYHYYERKWVRAAYDRRRRSRKKRK